MSFWQKIREGVQRMMVGRNGADEFSLALLIAGLVLSILGSATGLAVLDLLGMAAYVFSLFRMFSRNLVKRSSENQRFVSAWTRARESVRQFIVRVKNMRSYKYFKCPQCHARLKLPRKVGEVTVTCGKCKHSFKQKA